MTRDVFMSAVLVAPLTAGDIVLIMGGLFGGVCAVIYALKSTPRPAPPPPPPFDPNESIISEAVNRHGVALNNLNDAMQKVSYAVAPDTRPFVPVPLPAPIIPVRTTPPPSTTTAAATATADSITIENLEITPEGRSGLKPPSTPPPRPKPP